MYHNNDISMYLELRSFKGLSKSLIVMTSNIKPTLILASGLTAIFTTGIVVSKIPDSFASIKQMEEKTKQMEEKTKHMQLEIDLIKVKRKWFY